MNISQEELDKLDYKLITHPNVDNTSRRFVVTANAEIIDVCPPKDNANFGIVKGIPYIKKQRVYKSISSDHKLIVTLPLKNSKTPSTFYVDELVAWDYVPENRNIYLKVLHKDGDYYNNKPDNLKWVSIDELKSTKNNIILEEFSSPSDIEENDINIDNIMKNSETEIDKIRDMFKLNK